jgi:hypothetical protein
MEWSSHLGGSNTRRLPAGRRSITRTCFHYAGQAIVNQGNQQAVDTAYAEVFKVRRNPDGRISHVAWVKIPSKLCGMFHNLFAWYGYQEYLSVYIMPFRLIPMKSLDVHQWMTAVAAAGNPFEHDPPSGHALQ